MNILTSARRSPAFAAGAASFMLVAQSSAASGQIELPTPESRYESPFIVGLEADARLRLMNVDGATIFQAQSRLLFTLDVAAGPGVDFRFATRGLATGGDAPAEVDTIVDQASVTLSGASPTSPEVRGGLIRRPGSASPVARGLTVSSNTAFLGAAMSTTIGETHVNFLMGRLDGAPSSANRDVLVLDAWRRHRVGESAVATIGLGLSAIHDGTRVKATHLNGRIALTGRLGSTPASIEAGGSVAVLGHEVGAVGFSIAGAVGSLDDPGDWRVRGSLRYVQSGAVPVGLVDSTLGLQDGYESLDFSVEHRWNQAIVIGLEAAVGTSFRGEERMSIGAKMSWTF